MAKAIQNKAGAVVETSGAAAASLADNGRAAESRGRQRRRGCQKKA